MFESFIEEYGSIIKEATYFGRGISGAIGGGLVGSLGGAVAAQPGDRWAGAGRGALAGGLVGGAAGLANKAFLGNASKLVERPAIEKWVTEHPGRVLGAAGASLAVPIGGAIAGERAGRQGAY